MPSKTNVKDRYDKVKKCFEDKQCVLKTSLEEFTKKCEESLLVSHFRLDFYSRCGHENNVMYSKFKMQSNGVLCKKCTFEIIQKRDQDGLFEQENILFDKFHNSMCKNFDIVKSYEGALADLCIKPKCVEKDEYMRVQLKTTKGLCHRSYSFRLQNKYDNILILCYAIDDNKLWVLEHKDINYMHKLNIGQHKSKYNVFRKDWNELPNVITDYYYRLDIVPQDIGTRPQNIYQIREQEYARKREKALWFLHFEYPKIEARHYDFCVNGKKVQEKVAWPRNRNGMYLAHLVRTAGKNVNQDGKKVRAFNPYLKGMNDFYWINIPDSSIYFVIPEELLSMKGFIKTQNDNTRPRLYISLNSNEYQWYYDYQFDYSNVKEEQHHINKLINTKHSYLEV